MQVPPEMAFRGVEPTDEIKALILDGIETLEGVYPNLISCRTMIADTTPSRHSGNSYRVRLEIGIPSKSVIVDQSHREADDPLSLGQTIKEAFVVARKRLLKAKDQQRGDVKTHALPPHGRVVRLLTDGDGVRYGFLESREGRQIYFHEEALVDVGYDELEVGDEVRYAAAEGDQGPQASTVRRLNPNDLDPVQEKSVPLNR